MNILKLQTIEWIKLTHTIFNERKILLYLNSIIKLNGQVYQICIIKLIMKSCQYISLLII